MLNLTKLREKNDDETEPYSDKLTGLTYLEIKQLIDIAEAAKLMVTSDTWKMSGMTLLTIPSKLEDLLEEVEI